VRRDHELRAARRVVLHQRQQRDLPLRRQRRLGLVEQEEAARCQPRLE
jgi:hypothetical protein